jgi:hypothetical protein
LIAGAERGLCERELVLGTVVSIDMIVATVLCIEVAPRLAQHALDARSNALCELLDLMLGGLAERQKLELALLLVVQIHAIERDSMSVDVESARAVHSLDKRDGARAEL